MRAKAQARLSRLKPLTAISSTFLRPNRSAYGPAVSAPMARPTMPALITGPKAARDRPQSCISEGAMKPMTATSKPSNSTIRKHSTRISHW
ncbi:hypothetical protein D3C75_808170 [compost metagenome]